MTLPDLDAVPTTVARPRRRGVDRASCRPVEHVQWRQRALESCACLLCQGASGLYGSPRDDGDGDGACLYCGAGLVPDASDARSNGEGGVVLASRRSGTAVIRPVVSTDSSPCVCHWPRLRR